MQIAAQVFKMDTAHNGIIYFRDKEPAYITKRFDVKADGSKYLQEDFAQLLARTEDTDGPDYKFEGSYEDIGRFIKKNVAAYQPELEKLFKIIVFNNVVSNGDAHLKNFSLLKLDNGAYRLTPAYDLLCTVLHTNYESDTALDLYEDSLDSPFYSVYGYYGRPDFLELARRLGILEKRAIKIIDSFIRSEPLVKSFIERSQLTKASKGKYLYKLADKTSRLKPRMDKNPPVA